MGMFIHRRKQAHKKVVTEEYREPMCQVEPETNEPTKAEIEKLPYFSLKALALKHGLDVGNKKANQLRKELIKKIEEDK